MSEYMFAQTLATEEPLTANAVDGHFIEKRKQEKQHPIISNDYFNSGLADLAQELLNETQQLNEMNNESIGTISKLESATKEKSENSLSIDHINTQPNASQVQSEQDDQLNYESVRTQDNSSKHEVKDNSNQPINKTKTKNKRKLVQNDENNSDRTNSTQKDEKEPPKAKRKYKPPNQRRNIKFVYLEIFFKTKIASYKNELIYF
jgi:hypothetical protein